MRTVQMTLDDDLVRAVDRLARRLHTTRSGLTRRALRGMLEQQSINRLEERHRRGYEQHPATHDEFAVWEKEQKWGDE